MSWEKINKKIDFFKTQAHKSLNFKEADAELESIYKFEDILQKLSEILDPPQKIVKIKNKCLYASWYKGKNLILKITVYL